MAKIKLGKGGNGTLAEGVYVFKIVEVDDSKYETFGKLAIKLQTKNGATHIERFTLVKANGELNEGGLKAFTYFSKTALNNFTLDDTEIETNDLIGCYIKAEIKHEEYVDKEGNDKVSAKMNNWSTAVGFEDSKKKTKTAAISSKASDDGDLDSDDEDDEDVDSFLDED